MKIGILTYFEGANFGMNLQAYTSSLYFASLGHDVWVLNYSKDKRECDYSYCDKQQVPAHKAFVSQRLHLTERLSQNELLSFVRDKQFDVIAFGADAIWNKRDRVNLSVYTAQWLNGLEKQNEIKRRLKVIGLSPAFMGTSYSDLTDEERLAFKEGILNFTYPNVRDEWTREIVNREIMGSDCIKTINPDPVFLLNNLCVDRWEPIWNDIQSKKYYLISLSYSSSNNLSSAKRKWLKRLKAIVNAKGYKLVEIPLPEGTCGYDGFDHTIPYPIDPLQWFLWLKNAKGYIGLRFHAVVSCISSGTPFYSLDIYGNVPRWLNYLNRLGFHKYDRVLNKRSKIRNLLEGSGLEDYRMNGAYVHRLNPEKLINKLESCDIDKIIAFRDINVAVFKQNMTEALSN